MSRIIQISLKYNYWFEGKLVIIKEKEEKSNKKKLEL